MLAALMAGNHSTNCLHVFSNEIPEDTLRAIMNSNESIRTFGGAAELDFSGKGLGSADVKVLAELLKDNKTANCLKVFGNILGLEGGKAIAAVLETNETAEEVHMGNLVVGSVLQVRLSCLLRGVEDAEVVVAAGCCVACGRVPAIGESHPLEAALRV